MFEVKGCLVLLFLSMSFGKADTPLIQGMWNIPLEFEEVNVRLKDPNERLSVRAYKMGLRSNLTFRVAGKQPPELQEKRVVVYSDGLLLSFDQLQGDTRTIVVKSSDWGFYAYARTKEPPCASSVPTVCYTYGVDYPQNQVSFLIFSSFF